MAASISVNLIGDYSGLPGEDKVIAKDICLYIASSLKYTEKEFPIQMTKMGYYNIHILDVKKMIDFIEFLSDIEVFKKTWFYCRMDTDINTGITVLKLRCKYDREKNSEYLRKDEIPMMDKCVINGIETIKTKDNTYTSLTTILIQNIYKLIVPDTNINDYNFTVSLTPKGFDVIVKNIVDTTNNLMEVNELLNNWMISAKQYKWEINYVQFLISLPDKEFEFHFKKENVKKDTRVSK